jgi:hypothetical protein
MFPQSQKCLSFHSLLKDPWATLSCELNDQTLIRLIPLSVPLELPADDFYMNVIDRLVAKAVTIRVM